MVLATHANADDALPSTTASRRAAHCATSGPKSMEGIDSSSQLENVNENVVTARPSSG